MDSVLAIILTSSVIAAVITSVVNIIIELINSGRIKKIEQHRVINEIESFRFSKLYEVWKEMNDYTDDSYLSPEKAAEKAKKKRYSIVSTDQSMTIVIKPLMDDDIADKLEEELDKAIDVARESLSTKGHDEYFKAAQNYHKVLCDAILEQMTRVRLSMTK